MSNKKIKNLILIMIFVLTACSDTKEMNSQPGLTEMPAQSFQGWISSVNLPDKLELFGEKIPLDIPEVRERAEREFYVNLQSPGQIVLYMKRAGKYFEMFDKVIREHNMPEDFKYLSVAESALYMSRSPKDAVGLWQFIPETGRTMGLQIDDYIDERRHPEKSTDAAMKYLKMGYNKRNSWILAAAGYNMGHLNVKDNVQFQSTENFFDMFLNEETSRYILRIAIIKEIMKNPDKYGFRLSADKIYKPEKVDIIKWDTAIPNLSEWAKTQGTSYKDIKILNPWILKRALPAPDKGRIYEISVPAK